MTDKQLLETVLAEGEFPSLRQVSLSLLDMKSPSTLYRVMKGEGNLGSQSRKLLNGYLATLRGKVTPKKGDFIKVDQWIGRVLDMLKSEHRTVLVVQSLYLAFWENNSIIVIFDGKHSISAASHEMVENELELWSLERDSIETALESLKRQWAASSDGQFFQIANWVVELLDAASYDSGEHWRVRSAKQCFKNNKNSVEWLLDVQKMQPTPSTKEAAIASCDEYFERIDERYRLFDRIAAMWRTLCI